MTAPNVGILLPTRALLMQPEAPRDLEPILSMAKAMEDAGYDGAWVGDSLLASPRPEAIVTLAALATRTRQITVGTSILISSLRHPVPLAHQLATIDLLSGGRLIIGIGYSTGTGLWKLEHEVVGVLAKERRGRALEGIEVMRALWRKGETIHHGRFYDLDGISLEPKPIQPGGPPIWVHGMESETALRRVAQFGDGWINTLPTAKKFAESWERVRTYAGEIDRDPNGLTACHYSTIRVEADGAAARERGRNFMRAYYGGADPDEMEHIECCRYGTPEACAEELCRFVEAGSGTLILRLASENQREQLDMCSDRLLPLLKSAEVPSLA